LAETLNATSSGSDRKAKPKPHWRREINRKSTNPGTDRERIISGSSEILRKQEVIPMQDITRVPVVDLEGRPLMPTTPKRARLLLKHGKADARWSKLGVFYIRLKTAKTPNNQPLAVGVDPGSRFEGLSVVGTRDTVLNVMSEAVTWVKKAVEQRRTMRRDRRNRKTRCRACKSNRLGHGLPPSTRARWDAKLRIISQLQKVLPISTAVVEDARARTKPGQKRWNLAFSPLEAGKRYFHDSLAAMGLNVATRQGYETKKLRRRFHLKKLRQKAAKTFESHCVDSWVLAASETGAKKPTTKSLFYLVPLRWHRRQLHRLQPTRGERRRYGGTLSLGLKKGTLVRHMKHGLCYVGGNLNGRFSLHSLEGKRVTQNARRGEFKVLTRVAFRSQFLPALKNGVSLVER